MLISEEMKKIILSERKTKSQAALAGISLTKINEETGLGSGYISRKWGKGNVSLDTVSRIADAIGCSPLDLIEEVEE